MSLLQNQNEYSQALLDAMQVIAQSGDQSLQFDKTIECEIEYAVNSATGEYRARYLNQAIPVYDLSLEMTYKEKDIVFVSVPMSDFSNKKIIVGKKSRYATELKNIILDREKVNLVGLPMHQIYPSLENTIQEQGIYGSITEKGFIKLFSPTETKDAEFQGYAKGKTALMISANFKTNWYCGTVSSGNYGVAILFETKEDNQTLAYVLDINDMIGDPLKYNDYHYAETLLSIDGDNLKRIVSIGIFSKDFVRPDNKTEEELYERYISQNDAEIFVKDISIQFAETIDLDGYTVFISPVQGIYFNDKESLSLKAIMKYNGNPDVIDTSKVKYYWFERDPQISVTHIDYNAIGGIGWRDLKQNKQILTIEQSDFVDIGILSQKYKVVVLYENYKASNTINLYLNDNDSIDYELVLKYNADGRKADLEVNPTPDNNNYYAAWLKEDENGKSFILDEKAFMLKDIDIANINGIHKYYCGIVNKQNNRVILTLEQEVGKLVPEQEFTVNFNVDNNGIYYYDESGIVVNEYLNQSIGFSIYPSNFKYNYKWEFLNYQEDTFMYIPLSSGIEELSGNELTVDNSIDFQIRRKFERKAAEDNIIKLTITAGGKDYVFLKQLEFVKEGDPGTNGSSLIMRVNYLGNRAILSNTETSLDLNIQLYFNGSPTYDGKNVNTYFDFFVAVPKDYELRNPLKDLQLTFTKQSDSKWNLKIPSYTFNTTLPNSIVYIKAKSKNNKAFPYNIGYLMPIAQTTESIYQTYEFIGPTIIMYDEQGYSPKWDNSSLSLIDNTGEIITTNFDAMDDLVIDDGEIKPLQYFDPINLSYAVIADDCYIQPIAGELNAFSKSILNAWDGASIQIDEEGSYILAAQMGAGYKENDNSFTGVLMGILATSKDTLYPGTGLLGFNKGEGAFGFYTDGHAFIGQSGKGRIEFDSTGNSAIIKSPDANGMTIDLTAGKITANHFYLESSSILLDSLNNKFEFDVNNGGSFKIIGIKPDGTTKINLLNVSSGDYYLQSADYVNNTSGMRIDLDTGKINSYSFYLKSNALTIDSANNRLAFDIAKASGDTGYFKVSNGSNNMIYLSGNSQYIRSSNYVSGSSGLNINLKNGAISAANFSIDSNGNASFSGDISGSDGTFSGTLSGVDGTFSGTLSAVDGTFTGTLSGVDGYIGGWKINTSGIINDSGSAFLYANGSMEMGRLKVDTDGDVKVKSLSFYQADEQGWSNPDTIMGQILTTVLPGDFSGLRFNCSGGIWINSGYHDLKLWNNSNSSALQIHATTKSIAGYSYGTAIQDGVYINGDLYVQGNTNIGGGVAVFG